MHDSTDHVQLRGFDFSPSKEVVKCKHVIVQTEVEATKRVFRGLVTNTKGFYDFSIVAQILFQ